MQTKTELVVLVEAQLAASFPQEAAKQDFRSSKWRVGILEEDIVLRGKIAFSKGERVLFKVVDWSADLPVQAFSLKNNIVTGLFFNDIRESTPRDNSDLTIFDFSTMDTVDLNPALQSRARTIFADILAAKSMHWTGSDGGVLLENLNVSSLQRMALRPGCEPDAEEIAFTYQGEPFIPTTSGSVQHMMMTNLVGASPLDGLNWVLSNGAVLRLK